MAQKTPVSALTLSLSGTWTSLWYYEFTDIQNSWTSSLYLHYLLGAYFSFKRRLVQQLSVMQSNHVVYTNLQLFSVLKKSKFTRSAQARSGISPVLAKLALRSRLAILPTSCKKLLKKNNKVRARGLLSNYFYTFCVHNSTKSLKSVNTKKFSKRGLRVRRRSTRFFFFNSNNKLSSLRRTFSIFYKMSRKRKIKLNTIPNKQNFSLKNFMSFYLQYNKLIKTNKTLHFGAKNIKKLNFLTTSSKLRYLKTKKLYRNQKQLQKKIHSLRKVRYLPFYYTLSNKRTRLSLLSKRKQWYSTYNSKNINNNLNKNKKYFNKSFYKNNNLIINHMLTQGTPILSQSLMRIWRKDWKNLWRVRPRLRRKHFTKKSYLQRLKIVRSHKLRSFRRRKLWRSRLMKLSMLRTACRSITGFPVRLNLRRYLCSTKVVSKFKYAVVFTRWRYKFYFLPALLVVLVSVLRASSLLLMTWLLRLLKVHKSHSSLLYLVSEALKFFLTHPDTGRLYPFMRARGARLEVIGKIDGSDRSKTFRFQAGAIPTSTLNAPLNSEHAACSTIYGVLGISIWFFMKPTKPTLRISSSFKNTNLDN